MLVEQGLIKQLLAAALTVAMAGAAADAQAQTLGQTSSVASTPTAALAGALRQALGVSGQSPSLPLNFDPGQAPLTPGVARTAVDHSFGKGGLVGSAGFLCGRGAGPDNNGAATAYGYDPEGRFVGAKLSIAFK